MISTTNTHADIDLPSRLDSMIRVEAMIDDIGATLGVSEEVRANMQVAVGEAVKNAIEFGNQKDASKNVRFTVEKRKNEVVFIVKDQGAGFDVNNIADPTAPENIEKITGRGIFLIRNLADKVEFQDGGSKVVVSFNI